MTCLCSAFDPEGLEAEWSTAEKKVELVLERVLRGYVKSALRVALSQRESGWGSVQQLHWRRTACGHEIIYNI